LRRFPALVAWFLNPNATVSCYLGFEAKKNHENTKFEKHERIMRYFVISSFRDFVMKNFSACQHEKGLKKWNPAKALRTQNNILCVRCAFAYQVKFMAMGSVAYFTRVVFNSAGRTLFSLTSQQIVI
jgi:hypothetical protein